MMQDERPDFEGRSQKTRIIVAIHRGEKPGNIAARHGLDAGQVRRIHNEICGRPCPHKNHPQPEPEPEPEAPKSPVRAVPALDPQERAEPKWWETYPALDDYDDPPPPLLTRDDGHPLIPGEGHVEIVGAWGSAKSWIAQRIAVEALNKYRPVVYLRLEGHQRGLHQRLRMLGATDDAIRDPERFRSVTIDYLAEHREWAEWFAAPHGLIIIDTVSRAGGSGNDAAEAEAWLAANVTRFTDRGCLVVAVDHVAKHFADDLVAMSSRGSSAKTAAADYALHVVGHRKHGKRPVSTCWGPNHGGYVHLYVAKADRHGHIDTDGEHGAIATVKGDHDPATGGFRLSIDPPDADASADDKATSADRPDPTGAVLQLLADKAPAKLTQRQIVAAVHKPHVFTKTGIEDAIAHAVELSLITREDGPRNSYLHAIAATGRSLLP